jgi:hypothetical protein
MNNLLSYNFSSAQYTAPQKLPLDELCNGINVMNIGSSVAYVNGIPLSPPVTGQTVGDSYTIGGNLGEIIFGRVDISFEGGTGAVVVVQKFYVKR